jgi:hypothetical protein
VLIHAGPGDDTGAAVRRATAALPAGAALLLAEVAPAKGFFLALRAQRLAQLAGDYEVLELLSAFEDREGTSAPRAVSCLDDAAAGPARAARAGRLLWLDPEPVSGTPAWLVLARKR